MGIAMFTFGSLLAPLQGLLGLFVGPAPAPAIKPVAAHAHPMRAAGQKHPQRRAHRPLRVLRVADGSPAGAGRMVISGRMADVCAELDRLAALESASR
jgi:hypothetical protein